jgi:hypothetical protein
MIYQSRSGAWTLHVEELGDLDPSGGAARGSGRDGGSGGGRVRERGRRGRERNSSRLMYKITGSNFVKHLTVLVYALGTQDNSYHFYII